MANSPHPLENPVWYALTGPQATVAEGKGLALRYDPEVAAFAAMPDDVTPETWDALRDLVGPGAGAVLFRELEAPDGWNTLTTMRCLQMVADEPQAPSEPVGTELTAADVPDMLELVAITKPGPFLTRTIELGGYYGIRENGALIAMAGERMRLPGYTEVSAVCTLPEHRGRGLGVQLVTTVCDNIRARGEVPMLHVLESNTAAIALYEKLGFRTRTTRDVMIVAAPA